MAVSSRYHDQEATLMQMGSPKTGNRQPIVFVVAGVFGGIAMGLLIGAVLMAMRVGWSIRLLSLVGAPVGSACFWLVIRGQRPTETWRESLPALVAVIGLICAALNLILGVSAVYAVFTLSASAGLTAMAYLRFLAQLRVMRFVVGLIEDDDG